jgi:hypothetical protein
LNLESRRPIHPISLYATDVANFATQIDNVNDSLTEFVIGRFRDTFSSLLCLKIGFIDHLERFCNTANKDPVPTRAALVICHMSLEVVQPMPFSTSPSVS